MNESEVKTYVEAHEEAFSDMHAEMVEMQGRIKKLEEGRIFQRDAITALFQLTDQLLTRLATLELATS